MAHLVNYMCDLQFTHSCLKLFQDQLLELIFVSTTIAVSLTYHSSSLQQNERFKAACDFGRSLFVRSDQQSQFSNCFIRAAQSTSTSDTFDQ